MADVDPAVQAAVIEAIRQAKNAYWAGEGGKSEGAMNITLARAAIAAARPLIVRQAKAEALSEIVAMFNACTTCGLAHQAVTVPRKYSHSQDGVTWADPVDGHPYRRPAVVMLVDEALAQISARADAIEAGQ